MSQLPGWDDVILKEVAARHLSTTRVLIGDEIREITIFDDLSGWQNELIEMTVMRNRGNMDTSITFVAQYVPVGGRSWADVGGEHGREEDAALAIHQNIDEWDKVPERGWGSRPSRYRVIRREVSEAVLLETSDAKGTDAVNN